MANNHLTVNGSANGSTGDRAPFYLAQMPSPAPQGVASVYVNWPGALGQPVPMVVEVKPPAPAPVPLGSSGGGGSHFAAAVVAGVLVLGILGIGR
jgi:hypothetical protein